MTDKSTSQLENELIDAFLLAMKKGMTANEFFSVADATLEHLRGGTSNPIVEKIMNDSATAEDVSNMVEQLKKKENQ
ncbi:MAG: hypothetical protein OEZ55_08250 [Nitrospinota bacterium]|nr:hypothetical protein [Nitrospinota bacterium]